MVTDISFYLLSILDLSLLFAFGAVLFKTGRLYINGENCLYQTEKTIFKVTIFLCVLYLIGEGAWIVDRIVSGETALDDYSELFWFFIEIMVAYTLNLFIDDKRVGVALRKQVSDHRQEIQEEIDKINDNIINQL